MDFNRAQYEALIADIRAGLADFDRQLGALSAASVAAAGRWYMPAHVSDAVLTMGRESVSAGKRIKDLYLDLLQGELAPIFMFVDAWNWMDVRGTATGVSSALTAQHLVVDDSDWSGKARDAYVGSVEGHSKAAAQIGSIASSTAVNLLTCAAAGAAFYGTLAVVLAKLILATSVAIAALGSAVFSWAGVALIIGEAGYSTAVIATAIATLTAFLSAQATAMILLRGEAVDSSSFPGGTWPRANSSAFSDATVTDGDADWSLAQE
ncbi:hypothetical protein AWW66_09930 [Micromonospora rosaria]|uniref:ESX-1 secretion-associated protein EspA/EspE-like domain-containing protein n=1 Tax=Micromonospora rosaria TaxID=47874 RepID=A0A136PUM7_9ACTN|nr:hypothetical protein [Micromonospora rosaria]KXK62148.1 hypothetical protein AWW66_09930 [Micromonospora rosaria]